MELENIQKSLRTCLSGCHAVSFFPGGPVCGTAKLGRGLCSMYALSLYQLERCLYRHCQCPQ